MRRLWRIGALIFCIVLGACAGPAGDQAGRSVAGDLFRMFAQIDPRFGNVVRDLAPAAGTITQNLDTSERRQLEVAAAVD